MPGMEFFWQPEERKKGNGCKPDKRLLYCRVGINNRVGRVLSFSLVVGIGTPPTPHPQASVPSSFGSGGRGTLAGERRGGKVPIPTRGHTLWWSLYIFTLWYQPSEASIGALLNYENVTILTTFSLPNCANTAGWLGILNTGPLLVKQVPPLTILVSCFRAELTRRQPFTWPAGQATWISSGWSSLPKANKHSALRFLLFTVQKLKALFNRANADCIDPKNKNPVYWKC
jgi:hypothetical protein